MLGLGSAGQISFNYVLGEIVPVRHRFAANGFIFLTTLPFSGLGAYIARLFIENTSSSWRGIYYLTLALGTALGRFSKHSTVLTPCRCRRNHLLDRVLPPTKIRESPPQSYSHARTSRDGLRRNCFVCWWFGFVPHRALMGRHAISLGLCARYRHVGSWNSDAYCICVLR